MTVQWTHQKDNTLKGTDEEGNTYTMPANRDTCYCRTADDFSAIGWDADDALAKAIQERRATVSQEQNHTLQGLTNVVRDLVSTFDASEPLSLDELGQDINDALADTPTAYVPFFCTQLIRAAMLRGATDALVKAANQMRTQNSSINRQLHDLR